MLCNKNFVIRNADDEQKVESSLEFYEKAGFNRGKNDSACD
jgi:hypothetical protein